MFRWEGVTVCQSANVQLCHLLLFLKNEPLASSYEGIWFPISLCSDPDWWAIFNTTHGRDERRRWAGQAGCREPIKLWEFTSCHRPITDTGPPPPSSPGRKEKALSKKKVSDKNVEELKMTGFFLTKQDKNHLKITSRHHWMGKDGEV